ncbi:MAG: hypothetical protein LBJ74_04900 [Heliobacteriaceae bacterium]|jgi:tetratricopeptide (TPR) repeat protein|nr:hypothetical protein [Heliobacteriaceae bacterium]
MTLQLAEQYEDNEQYTEAFAQYKKLYAKNQKDLSIIERLGHLAMVLKIYDEAADYYTRILDFDATNAMAYEQLMDIYAHTDRYKYYVYRANLQTLEQKYNHAINDYKKAIANTQDEGDILRARFVLASLYEQTGQNMKAIDEYLRIMEHETAHLVRGEGGIASLDGIQEVYLKLANLYIKENALNSALETLERARAQGFDTPAVREQLAQLYLTNGNAQKALEVADNDYTKIKCLLECNKLDKASLALEKFPKNSGQYHSLNAQYYFMSGDYEKALSSVDAFDKFEKNSALSYQMRALIYEKLNDDFNAHLNWGRYNLVRGNKDIALNEFLSAYKLNGSDANLVNTLAIMTEESGDKHYAMEFYGKLSQLEPQNKTALEKLAGYYEKMGDRKAQEEYLSRLAEIDPRNAAAKAKLENLRSAAPDEESEGLLDKFMRFFNKG